MSGLQGGKEGLWPVPSLVNLAYQGGAKFVVAYRKARRNKVRSVLPGRPVACSPYLAYRGGAKFGGAYKEASKACGLYLPR